MCAQFGKPAPAAQHCPLTSHALQRFHAGNRFDEKRLLQAVISLGFNGSMHNLALQPEAIQRHKCHGDNRHKRQHTGDIGYQRDEEDKESQIDNQHDCRRGEEIAHDREFRNPRHEVAGVSLAFGQRRSDQLAKYFL